MFDPAPAFLLADASSSLYLLLSVCVACAAVFGTLLFIARRYKRCPSNRVLVIYGKSAGGRAATCIHGGGRFVLPLIQDYAWLSLEPMQIEIPLRGALSMENIRVNVPSVFTVAIGTTPEHDAERGHPPAGPAHARQIKKQAEDIIFGQLRQVIASMQIEDINRDREKFLRSIQNSLEPELQQDRPGADQRQHHRHHRRVGLYRGHRPEGGLAGDPEGPRRRGRQREDGRNPRGRGRAREGRSRWPTPTSSARSAPARPLARAGRPRRRARQGAAGRRAVGRLRRSMRK